VSDSNNTKCVECNKEFNASLQRCPHCGVNRIVKVNNETIGILEKAEFLKSSAELEKQLQEILQRNQTLQEYWKVRNQIVHQQTTEKLQKEIGQKTKELKEYTKSIKEQTVSDEGLMAYLQSVRQTLGIIDGKTKQEEKSKADDIIERLQRIEENQGVDKKSAKKHNKINYVVSGIAISLAIFSIILAFYLSGNDNP